MKNAKEFNEAYHNAETVKVLRVLIESLSASEIKELIDAHNMVNITTGLDMRQELFLQMLYETFNKKEATK